MKLRLQLSGGFGYFPGLAARRELDTATLAPADAQRVRNCLEDAHFFERPSSQASTLPDARRYTITVMDGARSRVLSFSDPLSDPPVERLVELLSRLTRSS